MTSWARSHRAASITAAVMALVILSCAWQPLAPGSEPVENALIIISDFDSIDAGRGSNSVYRIGLDGRGGGVDTHPSGGVDTHPSGGVDTHPSMKRVIGAIPHGGGYLRTSDIDCDGATQQLLIASYQRDLNGFHHSMLDGSQLHLDEPKTGEPLLAVREIALAPAGAGIIVSREYGGYAPPRFGLASGDLLNRDFKSIKLPTPQRSYLSPDWSPDGQRIAYIIVERAADEGLTMKLAVAKPDGSGERVIHESSRPMADLAWSPDGDWLAVTVDRQVYRIHRHSGERDKLTKHLGGAGSPRWSPDGRMISYVAPSSYPGFHQLMVMDADGSHVQQVASIYGDVLNGCWV